MKFQTVSNDMAAKDYGFQKTLEALLATLPIGASAGKHPIKRVKYKITFYWE